MCGRYALKLHDFSILDELNIDPRSDFVEGTNIAPSEIISVVSNSDNQLALHQLPWGFHTGWSKGPPLLINLKSEEIINKAFARTALQQNRCIFPATGFFEWKTVEKKKKPVFFEYKDGEVFGLAGLLFKNQKGESEGVILTVAPNRLVSQVHNRMPVVIQKENWNEWIRLEDPSAALNRFAKSFDAAEMHAWEVNEELNNARYKGEIKKLNALK